MNPYFTGGFILVVLGALTGLIFYANRAGRNAACVKSDHLTIANANASTIAVTKMLAAKTNSIRSDNQLLSTLAQGRF